MKRARLAHVLVWLGLVSFASPAVVEAQDPFQRIFRFHNQMATAIYPVIQAGQATNCPGKYPPPISLRIIVNGIDGRGKGIKPGETVDVKIPKSTPDCPKGYLYDAGRILIFAASVDEFDKVLRTTTVSLSANQATTELFEPWTQNLCQTVPPTGQQPQALAGCWGGKATADYGPDAPFQLNEYTVISQIGPAGSPNGADDPAGRPNIGFNVSYVDNAYLPVALGMGGGGTGFLGTVMTHGDFNARLASFLVDGRANWSQYAAYNPTHFQQTTIFNGLVARTDNVPSGYQVLNGARTKVDPSVKPVTIPPDGSGYYLPVWDGVTEPGCSQGAGQNPPINLGCVGKGTDCCPGPLRPMETVRRFSGCCDIPPNALIDEVHRSFNVQTQRFTNTNPTLFDLTQRWLKWRLPANQGGHDCANPPPAPVIPDGELPAFCTAFKRAVNFLWTQFTTFETDEQCNLQPQPTGNGVADPGHPFNQCVATAIIGFTIKNTGFDANKCKLCPNTDSNICPETCSDERQRTQSTIALLRGVPWTGEGPTAQCSCPSTTGGCSQGACVFPLTPSPLAKRYHWDKFLHFWPDYDNAYNLNPYAGFVHRPALGSFNPNPPPPPGLNALSVYGFSIDDFYGFLGAFGNMLIVNVGGKEQLHNQEPRDPFAQYTVTTGPGWFHARVCGREFPIPPPRGGQSFPLSFWKFRNNAWIKDDFCEVVLYSKADKSEFVKFLVQEQTMHVVDSLRKDSTTNPPTTHTVLGLSGASSYGGGILADRGTPLPPPERDTYCLDGSNHPNKQNCIAKLTPSGGDQAYVGVTDCASGRFITHPSGPLSGTGCRPLTNLTLTDMQP